MVDLSPRMSACPRWKTCLVALGQHISLGDLAKLAAIKAKVAKVAFITLGYMIDACSPIPWVAATLFCYLCLDAKKRFLHFDKRQFAHLHLSPGLWMAHLRVVQSRV